MTFKKTFTYSSLYPLICLLLIILIILVSILIYIYTSKKIIITTQQPNNTTNTHVGLKTDTVYITKAETTEIPVYPRELPKYNKENYQQVGILTSNDKEPLILPLFSRKLHNHSDRYNYYTATDKNNMMRLPIRINNADCEDTIGCKEIYDKDTINVEIYKDRVFTATIYKIDAPQYFADRY